MDFAITDNQMLLRKSIIEFARKELNEHVIQDDEEAVFPREKWNKCAGIDIMALQCPQEYGGCKEDLITTAIALEALSYACTDSGLTHAIVTQLCCMVPLNLFGNIQQKQYYIKDLSTGFKIAAQALTEPDAGSDVLSMRTQAVKTDGYYVVNGSKTFISNGPLADLVMTFAVTDPQKKGFGVSCFLVDAETDGFKRGRPLDKLGLRTMHNGELFYDDCRVSEDALLGREGQGMMVFNEVIEWERVFMMAVHLGTLERIIEQCVRYARGRKQFGRPIGSYQSISNKIADMKVALEMGRMMMLKAAWLKDQGKRATLETSVGKLFVSENLKKSCLDAIQIHGGYGFMKEYELERDLRDSIAATIYSGTSELQRNIISKMAGL